MLSLTVLMSFFVGRTLQTQAESGRLRLDGFTSDILYDGFCVIIEEREQRRRQLRAEARVVKRRRQTVVMGLFLVVCAPALIAVALRFRVTLPSGRGYQTSLPGVIMLFSGLVMLGMGIVVLLRSPFPATVPERLFRALAFGPLSKLLVGARAA
jgi:hypothetical protein